MRIGLFLILPQPPGTTQQHVFEAALDDALTAERLGFDSVWVTEHHGSGYGLSAAPSVVAAAIAARTTRVAIGYAVNVTPLHLPVRLAEEIATVDQISGGRVIAGFGPGYSPVEFQTMGADFATRHRAHHHAVGAVVDQWRTGGGVRPRQTPHPAIAVTAAGAEAASWAARHGYDLLTLGDEAHTARLRHAYRRPPASASGPPPRACAMPPAAPRRRTPAGAGRAASACCAASAPCSRTRRARRGRCATRSAGPWRTATGWWSSRRRPRRRSTTTCANGR